MKGGAFLFVLISVSFGFVIIVDGFRAFPSSQRLSYKVVGKTAVFANTKKGVYVRPSAAIERGSGFFVPGLEGPRVRLLFGLLILVLTAVNHSLSATISETTTSESLAIGFSILLLLQAAIEFGKEEKGFVVSLNRPDISLLKDTKLDELSLVQRWATDAIELDWKDKVEWSAASYIAITPATMILLLEKDRILYSLGPSFLGIVDTIEERLGCNEALKALENAKTDRILLPKTHPATSILSSLESKSRCIILQNVGKDRCLMMISDQLIQAFTKNDLRWLGQIANYIK
jgi:Cofactor assembly of complex C subunit B, CCB2/CCB4